MKHRGVWAEALLLALLAPPAPAFVLHTVDTGGTLLHPRWSTASLPVRFRLNDRPLTLLPNLAGGSMPVPAIQAAMQTWSFPPIGLRLDGTTPALDAIRDGVNLITLADTSRNRDIAGDQDALTLLWTEQQGSQIRIAEADIVVNPQEKLATDGRAGVSDVQNLLTHELGHALGLAHSPLLAATMFPFGPPGETLKRRLEADDIAGLRALYAGDLPAPGGAIAGQVVTTTGTPVFGAHVLATDAAGIARVGVLTDRSGGFTIPSLPAGDYQVYTEPLDGPMTPDDIPDPYFHDPQHLVAVAFRTTFAGDNITPALVHVDAGKMTSLAPIRVPAQPPTLNPLAIAGQDGNTDYEGPILPLRPGGSLVLWMIGPGLETVPDAGFHASSADIVLDTSHPRRGTLRDGMPFAVFRLFVRPGAPPGPRSLFVVRASELAAYSGGLQVLAP